MHTTRPEELRRLQMDAILEAIESKSSDVYGTTTAAMALTGGKIVEPVSLSSTQYFDIFINILNNT